MVSAHAQSFTFFGLYCIFLPPPHQIARAYLVSSDEGEEELKVVVMKMLVLEVSMEVVEMMMEDLMEVQMEAEVMTWKAAEVR